MNEATFKGRDTKWFGAVFMRNNLHFIKSQIWYVYIHYSSKIHDTKYKLIKRILNEKYLNKECIQVKQIKYK